MEEFQMNNKSYSYIVYIGRFQPPHHAHIKIIKQALEQATEGVIILIGSAKQPRTIKNPFTYEERRQMILSSLPEYQHKILHFAPLRDIPYNDQKWASEVQRLANEVSYPNQNHGIIGHSKDESSYYLKMFPQWELVEVGNIEDINATKIRKALFAEESDFDLNIGRNLPTAIHDWIKAFMLTPWYEQLVREYKFISNYRKSWETSPYMVTFVTVDAVVIQSGHVLLVRRRAEPGRGTFALPGGFVGRNESLIEAALRELREETRIKVPAPVLQGNIKCCRVYDHPKRSLRGRTITHVYLIELPSGPLPKVKGGDDADKAKWIPLNTVAQMEDLLFEDHYSIIEDILGKL